MAVRVAARPLRTYWKAVDLDDPETGTLWMALLRYRQKYSRFQTGDTEHANRFGLANLLSSKTTVRGVHLPIIDLDIAHEYQPSTTPGRAHVYLNEPIRTWRWVILMWGLRIGRVTEQGYFLWSLRRGQNFVRLPGVRKNRPVQFKPAFGARNPTHE